MSLLRRLAVLVATLWVLVATNPDAASFRKYIDNRRAATLSKQFRAAVPPASAVIKRVLAPMPPLRSANFSFDGLDCGTCAHG
jgi:hypothetical protein